MSQPSDSGKKNKHTSQQNKENFHQQYHHQQNNEQQQSYPIYSPDPHQIRQFPQYNMYVDPNAPYIQQGVPYQVYPQMPPYVQPVTYPPTNSYQSPFLYPQSSIFFNYLQSIQYVQKTYGSSYPQHSRHSHHHSQFSPASSSISIPRGPPKKPKQSGFALWVGNLPPNTTLIELCSLFGTNEIQSIFLIQRTLCAFVNYISEAALKEGIRLFEKRGSSLRGNHLVVKIKTGSKEEDVNDDSNPEEISATEITNRSSNTENRYFICKSLTVEDLHASVRLGLWDTQSHNQATFNQAFKTCKNVYLIFSANRAGEYFGYARMAGEIPKSTDPDLLLIQNLKRQQKQLKQEQQRQQNQHPNAQSTSSSQFYASIPQIYPTMAQPQIPIPAGRIVDDSARGILFWEASTSEAAQHHQTSSTSESKNSTNNWTIPFKVEWLSPSGKTVSFYKVRNLRNPYNKNRYVKIARDGTEIEPSVGKKIIEIFHS